MINSKPNIGIVGGGIGEIAAAVALFQVGIDAVVYERLTPIWGGRRRDDVVAKFRGSSWIGPSIQKNKHDPRASHEETRTKTLPIYAGCHF